MGGRGGDLDETDVTDRGGAASVTADIAKGLADARGLLDWLAAHEQQDHTIARITERLVATLKSGGRILSCGNGGSMCDAMHFAEELSGRYRNDRRALSAQAISDPAHLTCVANDYGFEHVFSRGVEAYARPGDAIIMLSTSGKSANLLRAAEAARARQVTTIGLLGKDGGPLKGLCDLSLVVPGQTSDRIQEIHIKVVHLLIEGIEAALFG